MKFEQKAEGGRCMNLEECLMAQGAANTKSLGQKRALYVQETLRT